MAAWMTRVLRGGRLQATAVLASIFLLTPLHAGQTGVPAARGVRGGVEMPSMGVAGLREPAWSPDGRRLAVVFLDRLWTVTPDGGDPRAVIADASTEQREPAWAPDGRRIAFAMDVGSGFDVYVAPAGSSGRRPAEPEHVTTLTGDERWPSWTPDGRLVFAHRAADSVQWDLWVVEPAGNAWGAPLRLTDTADHEMQPRVSPDGLRIAYASDRDSDEGDLDIWVTPLPEKGVVPVVYPHPIDGRSRPTRVVNARGLDGYPAWSPNGKRIGYYGVRDGVASTWVSTIDPPPINPATDARAPRERQSSPAVLASHHAGTLAWSPDGRTLAIGELPEPEPVYNGNPHRDRGDPPPVFGVGRAYQLWSVPAPREIDEGGRALAVNTPTLTLTQTFDRVWSTLKRLYYDTGDQAAVWEALREKYHPQAEQARSENALEDVVDRLIAEQPLIKPAVVSSRAVVVSGHPLASEAGRLALANGGNVVDAAIAVSFALGIVEPEASGLGGDGQAVLYLKGMPEPTVVEYKDQTPMRATLDNTRIFRDGVLVGDGPAAANIPGVVAGLDYLYTHYGSGRVSWADLIEPAIRYAEQGYVLDTSLPSSIAEGRQFLEKYPESARIFLPNGRVPRPGDRFINRDYGATLRTIARDGAETFYRGAVARRIAADMEASGGIMTYEDLAQYHAVERRPVTGRYRNHVLYTGGPPVQSGVALLETLQILDNYKAKPGATPATDAEYWHYLIESWKARDPIRRIADPGLWKVDYESHLRPSHAESLFRRIDPGKAMKYLEDDREPRIGPGGERIGRGTSGFAVADAEGNMIAVTQTLSTWGGTFYVSRGLGFLYNNHLRSNRTQRGSFGQLLPRMRSNTASVPTLVFREEGGERMPRLAVGVAGNAWIPASAYSIITAVIDGGLPMQRAIEAPRFLVSYDPGDPLGTTGRIEIEDRFPRTIIEDLRARGHLFQKIGRKGEVRYGYASAVLVDVASKRVEGGSEPRRSHMAVAFEGGLALTQQP
jgi:gamma-glutamyltranspeptidase